MSGENAHTIGDLRQMQSLPLPAKIAMTKERIRAWYEYFDGGVYVSFSGGKDSTVLLNLAREVYSDIPAVFCNTGLEYPEIVKFAGQQSNIEIVRPEMNFADVIDRYGYPMISKEVSRAVSGAKKALKRKDGSYQYDLKRTRGELLDKNGNKSMYNCEKWGFLVDAQFDIGNMCCGIMKKKPMHEYGKKTGRKAIIGTMAEESRQRRTQWIRFGCNAWNAKDQQSKPLSFWTENDILQYLKEREIPYAPVYGEIIEDGELPGQMWVPGYKPRHLITTGCDRTGCVFCGFGCHLEKEPNRYQRLARTHPTLYDYCIRDTAITSRRTGQPPRAMPVCKTNKEINLFVQRERG